MTSGVLVALPADRCPDCGEPTADVAVGQRALFRHGGYGETRVTTLRLCRCGWQLTAAVASAR